MSLERVYSEDMDSRIDAAAIEDVDLFPVTGPGGRVTDPVDPSAAFILDSTIAQQAGVIPFRFENGHVCVAAAFPLSKAAQEAIKRIAAPVKIYRSSASAITHSHLRVMGAKGHTRAATPFGEVAESLGLTSDADIDDALTEQAKKGGRLGQILVNHQVLTYWDVASVLSAQTALPLVNLLAQDVAHIAFAPNTAKVWEAFSEDFWRRHRMAPIGWESHAIILAVEDPTQWQGIAEVERHLQSPVKIAISGKRDIEAVLDERYRQEDMTASRDSLLIFRPEDSAKQTVTRRQAIAAASIVVMVAGAMIWKLDLTFAVISSLLIIMYSVTIGYRLWMIRQGTDIPAESLSTSDELASLDDRDLPVYTILVPAREEAAVLPALTKALDELDYPKDRLDVKLLLEEDDDETIHAARSAHLPSFIDIVIVPADNPRTKPKACNYGLLRARGEYVTIFDAEDIPEPLQLKKAILAFRKHDDKLACVQAKLSYFNANQNLLTRWFTAEYASWFDLFLPSLYAAKLPIPLGGTSNHFRTDRLRELGGWDPYNVTEDADLGIRLYKAGYYASVIDSNTYEEANSEFVNWVRQRSRWIKGYIQTWLVHMRHPLKLYQSMGPRGFWGFQMSILGTPLMFLLNPLYWFLTSLWFMTNWHIIPSLFPPGIYYLGMINLLGGNFIFTYINALGAAKHGNWDLVPYTLLTPIYWSMMSLASWKALVQLITRPSHWEKTIHGLSAPHQLPPIANAAPVQESTM